MNAKTTLLKVMKKGNSPRLLLEFLSENQTIKLGAVTDRSINSHYFTVEIEGPATKARELQSYLNINLLF